MKRTGWPLVVALGFALSFYACGDTWKGVQKDTEENAEAVKRAMDKDAPEVRRDVGDDVDKAAGKVKAKAEEVGREIASETQAAMIHMDIKQALILDDTIDAAHINVDVDDNAQRVILKGSVPTLEQKAGAERIARERCRGYEVRNELSVTSK